MDRKIASLIAAVEAGVNLSQITEQLNRRAREPSGPEAEMCALPSERLLDPAELHQAMEQLGGLAKILATAESSAREKISNSLGSDWSTTMDPGGSR